MNEKTLYVNEAKDKWWPYAMRGQVWTRHETERAIIADNYMGAAKKLIDQSGEKLHALQYCTHRHGVQNVRAILLEVRK